MLHSGVVINGREYAYGGHDRANLTGVYWTRPKTEPPGGTFRCSVLHGFTFASREEIDRAIRDASEEFLGTGYNLLTRNCNHFTAFLCRRLTGRPGPAWLNRAAGIGVALPCVVPRDWIEPPEYDEQGGELLDEDDDEDDGPHVASERSRMLKRTMSEPPRLVGTGGGDGGEASSQSSSSTSKAREPQLLVTTGGAAAGTAAGPGVAVPVALPADSNRKSSRSSTKSRPGTGHSFATTGARATLPAELVVNGSAMAGNIASRRESGGSGGTDSRNVHDDDDDVVEVQELEWDSEEERRLGGSGKGKGKQQLVAPVMRDGTGKELPAAKAELTPAL